MIALRRAILMKAKPVVSLHAHRLFSGRVCSCKKDPCCALVYRKFFFGEAATMSLLPKKSDKHVLYKYMLSKKLQATYKGQICTKQLAVAWNMDVSSHVKRFLWSTSMKCSQSYYINLNMLLYIYKRFRMYLRNNKDPQFKIGVLSSQWLLKHAVCIRVAKSEHWTPSSPLPWDLAFHLNSFSNSYSALQSISAIYHTLLAQLHKKTALHVQTIKMEGKPTAKNVQNGARFKIKRENEARS